MALSSFTEFLFLHLVRVASVLGKVEATFYNPPIPPPPFRLYRRGALEAPRFLSQQVSPIPASGLPELRPLGP